LKDPLLGYNFALDLSSELDFEQTIITLGSIEIFNGHFDFGGIDVYILSIFIYFYFADIPEKLAMDENKKSLVEFQSTLVFLLCDGHGDYTLVDFDRNYFVIGFN